jgi:CubicO group peptidase (beta-lactamase class C family)
MAQPPRHETPGMEQWSPMSRDMMRRLLAVSALTSLVLPAWVGVARQAPPARQPASRSAAVLTWNQAQREAGFAAMESIFLTRTVRAGSRSRPLAAGRAFSADAAGGRRATDLDQFVESQKVAGVLVLHDGTVRLERYALTGGPRVRWHSFSIAKSITSTLAGAAMKDGHIRSLDDPVTRYIAGLRGSAYDGVTVRQLLTMTSGVRWNEDYTDLQSDVARMYAAPPDPGFDMTVSYVRKLPREAPPGTKWVYKTSETNLVGVLVAEATRKPLAEYLSEKIWRAYAMERDAEWMIDDVGHEQGGCCLAMTLRDLARFGQFILDGARVDGVSIVPDTWLTEATRNQVPDTGSGSGYGYQWWPRDDGAFEGRGIYGQTLHIDPARRLVIVINSAAEQPTGREQGRARQAFIAAVKAEIDAEKKAADAPGMITRHSHAEAVVQTSFAVVLPDRGWIDPRPGSRRRGR